MRPGSSRSTRHNESVKWHLSSHWLDHERYSLSRLLQVFLSLAYAGTLRQVTIIHKSNVLSIADGLFRETVRAVPSLLEVAGHFHGVAIAEQIVDSAVYRFDSLVHTYPKITRGITAGTCQDALHRLPETHHRRCGHGVSVTRHTEKRRSDPEILPAVGMVVHLR